MSLDAIEFKVETKELDDAITKIGTLQRAVKDLGTAQGGQSARQQAKEQNQITLDAIKNETALTAAKAKRAEAENKLQKAASASGDATAQAADKSKDKIQGIITQLEMLEKYMGQGFTRGFAGTMAKVEQLGGGTVDQMKALGDAITNLGKLMKSPFDDAIGPIQSINRELEKVQSRANLAAQGISLSNKQLDEYSKITASIESQQRAKKKDIFDPKVIEESTALITKAQQEYLTQAQKYNAMIQQEQPAHKTQKIDPQLKALQRADEMLAKLDNRIVQMSHHDPISPTAANSLFMYEKALKQAGVAADVAATKVEAFRKKQQQVSDLNLVDQQKKIEHLSRALAPQVTDITVGLMTGQNPFTVFLQQGGQVRDMIGLSRVETEKLGEVFKKTFSNMGDMVAGMGRALLAFMLTPTGMVVTGLSVMAVATYGTIKALLGLEEQSYEMNKALVLSNNTMGLTKSSLWEVASAASKVDGISLSGATAAVAELTKAGVLTRTEFQAATESAVLFEKYGGGSVKETADIYKKLSDDPVKSVLKLSKETSAFTDVIIQQVAAAEEEGNKAKAAQIAREGYAAWQKQMNVELKASLGEYGSITEDVTNWFTGMWNSVNNYQRPLTVVEKLQQAKKALEDFDKSGGASLPQRFIGDVDRGRPKLVADLAAAQLADTSEKNKAAANVLIQTRKELERVVTAYEDTYKIKPDAKEESKSGVQVWYEKAVSQAIKDNASAEELLKLVNRRDKILTDISTGKAGPKKASVLKDFSLGNETAQYEKQYNIQLRLQENFIQQEKTRLENSLNAKEITQGEFIVREQALVLKGEQALTQLYDKTQKERTENYVQDVLKVIKAQSEDKLTAEKAQQKITDLGNAYETLSEQMKATADKTRENGVTRFDKQLSLLRGSLVSAKEELLKFQQAEASLLEQRSRTAQQEDALRIASPEQKVFLQAYNQEQERFLKITEDQTVALKQQENSYKAVSDEADRQQKELGYVTFETLMLLDAEKKLRDFRKSNLQNVIGGADSASLRFAQEAQLKYQKDQAKAFSDSIASAVETGLLEGGEAGKKSLRKTIEAELRKPITVFIQAVVGGLTGLVTSGASAAGLAGGATSGGIGGWLNAGSTIKSAWDAMTGGFSAGYQSFATSTAGQYLGLSETGMSMPLASNGYAQTASITPTGTAVGTGLGYVGAGLAGIGVGSAIAGDKSFAGLSGQDASAIGAIIGGIAGGPLGAFIGGVAGGMFNAAFGEGAQEFEATRLVGGFTGTGFSGDQRTRWSKEGGWFSSGSSGEDVRGLGTAQQQALNLVTQGTKSVFDNLIKSAGESEKSIASWTFAIDRQVNSEEQQKQLIIDMASSMGNLLIPSLKDFIKTGENLADTAVRMNDEFLLTNKLVELLGQNTQSAFGAIGLASLGARDNLVELMGGISAMTTTTQGYYENFFSETERHDNDLKVLTKTFKDIGVVIPETREGFRSLVESQDLSTLAGRTLVAQLLGLQGAFAAVTDSTEDQTAAYESMLASGKSIYEWLQKLKTSALGLASPQEAQASTRSSYLSDLSLARVGNTDALGNITGSAESYLQASMDASSSFNQYKAILAQVQSEVGGVPAVVSYQQELLNSANASLALAQQQNALLFSIAQSTALMSGTTAPSLLTTAANGSLSVGSTLTMTSSTATSTTAGTSDVALVAIRDELVGLRYEVRAGVEAEVKATKILTRVSRDGENFQVLTGAVYNLP